MERKVIVRSITAPETLDLLPEYDMMHTLTGDVQMQKDYVKEFEENVKLKLTDVTLFSKDHQNMICLLCGSTHTNATAKAKMMSFRKYGLAGCDICTRNATYAEVRKKNISTLEKKFVILTNLDTVQVHNKLKLKVQNKTCGHIFESQFDNLLNAGVNCPVCNNISKLQYLKK